MEEGVMNGKELKNKTTIIIKDAFGRASITREDPNLEDMLSMIENCLKASGFCFKGNLTIDEEMMSLDFTLNERRECGVCLDDIFHVNITHNLTKMADKAELYEALWHPYRLLPNYPNLDKGDKDFYKKDWAFERDNIVKASFLIPIIKIGLSKLKVKPEYYEKFNPSNGWGSYESFVKRVSEILAACEENPDSIVKAGT